LKIKLDENLGRHAFEFFRAAGYDTATVAGQNVCGTTDFQLIHLCKREERALITLDLDFANPLLFRPSEYCGIAILRTSKPFSDKDLEGLCRTLVEALVHGELAGHLWIIEHGRIRVYQEREQ
jgi:predicted nuclease of predicted toxin-antitoxin system